MHDVTQMHNLHVQRALDFEVHVTCRSCSRDMEVLAQRVCSLQNRSLQQSAELISCKVLYIGHNINSKVHYRDL